MNTEILARSSMGILLLALLSTVILTPLGFSHLPPAMQTLVTSNPMYKLSQSLNDLFIISVVYSAYLTFRKNSKAKLLIIFSFILLLLSIAILGFNEKYYGMGSLNELTIAALGVLFAYSTSRYNFINFRIIAIITIVMSSILISSSGDCFEFKFLLPAIHISVISGGIIGLLYLLSLIFLCFKSKLAKYLLPLTLLLIICDNLFYVIVGNTLIVMLDYSTIFIASITVGITLFSEIANQFKSDSLQAIKRIPQSFYSLTAYKTVSSKKGSGIMYMVTLFFIILVTTTYGIYSNSAVGKVTSVLRQTSNVPTVHWDKNGLKLNAPAPYILKDKLGYPILIYDNTGKYKTLNDTSEFVQVLETPDKIFIRNIDSFTLKNGHGQNIAVSQELLVNILDFLPLLGVLLGTILGVIFYFGLVLFRSYADKHLMALKLDGKMRMRLGLYARTPVIIFYAGLNAYFGFVGQHFETLALLFALGSISLIYLRRYFYQQLVDSK